MDEKIKKRFKTGFILSIIQVCLLLVSSAIALAFALSEGWNEEAFFPITGISFAMAVIVLILTLVARKGKKSAAIALIVIGCFMYLYAIFSLIGGVFMFKVINDYPWIVMQINRDKELAKRDKQIAKTVGAAAMGERRIKDGERGILARLAGFKEKFVRADMGSSVKTFVTLTVFYAVVLALALASYFTYFFKVFEGSFECRAVCSMIIALMPAYLVYFGAHNPFKFKKAVSVLLITLGALGFAGCDVLLIFSALDCLAAAAHGGVIMFFAICVIIAQIVLALGFTLFCKGLPSGWYIGFGMGGIIVLPLLAALIISVVVVIAIVILAIFLIRWIGFIFAQDDTVKSFMKAFRGEPPEQRPYTFINSMGCEQTVYSTDGKKFYNSDGSYAGSSNDGGKTINFE